jgi:23S rRNA (guanine2445-N2)-methyltransferase / 23S rRNA (guanine2069-N7)-methyltransferase
MAVVGRVFALGTDSIVLKQRKRQQGSDQYQRQTEQGETLTVQEHGCLFEVNLRDYLDTGLFLDHRPVRQQIQSLAKGKRFLNLFCYTATASVHAAVGGAASTTSVDMSATYLDWARRNFELNKLDAKRADFVQADCIQWLDRPRSETFDLIFMDPPTFSNSKRMSDILDVQRDHVMLIKGAMALLEPGGLLIFSNNYRRFKLDYEQLDAFEIVDTSHRTIDPDFKRNSKIHYSFEIRHKA